MATNQKVGGSNPLRRAKKQADAFASVCFFRVGGFEDDAVVNGAASFSAEQKHTEIDKRKIPLYYQEIDGKAVF